MGSAFDAEREVQLAAAGGQARPAQGTDHLPAELSGDGGPQDATLFYITLGAVLDESVPQDVLLKRLSPGITNAKVYWRRPFLLAVESMVQATSRLEATLKVAENVREAFPAAEFVDVSSLPNNLIAALDGLSEEGVLTEREFEDALGPFAAAPGIRSADRTTAVWVEAEVFEVLDLPEAVHLRSSDSRILAFNRGTSLWNGFQRVEEGQRFRCLVVPKFGVVLRAERLLD